MENITKRGLYVLKTHPYNEDIQNIKISGNPEYTSPILNYFEEKKGKYDTETGVAFGDQIHSIYYDSKQGKFIKRLINKNLLNTLTFDVSQELLLSEIQFKNDSKEIIIHSNHKEIEKSIKKNFINRKVSLRSIYIELTKKKINISNTSEKLIETNHLDFLPPVMQIIGFRFNDEKKKFCEETGDLKLEFKCKWFNNITKTFSEEFLPYQALVCINDSRNETSNITGINNLINSNGLIQYSLTEQQIFQLEGFNIKITQNVMIPKKIVFNHYYHEVNGSDLIKQKNSRISDISKIKILPDNVFSGKKYPFYESNRKENIFDCSFSKNTYMLVKYKDKFDRITDRVIRISEILFYFNNKEEFDKNEEYSKNNIQLNDEGFAVIDSKKWQSLKQLKKKLIEDKNLTIIIKGNCLLRDGKIRHFRLDGFLNILEINSFKLENIEKDDSKKDIFLSIFENQYPGSIK